MQGVKVKGQGHVASQLRLSMLYRTAGKKQSFHMTNYYKQKYSKNEIGLLALSFLVNRKLHLLLPLPGRLLSQASYQLEVLIGHRQKPASFCMIFQKTNTP